MTTTPNTIPVVQGWSPQQSGSTYHKPGCGHIRFLEDVTGPTDCPIEVLLAWEVETKRLGQHSVIGPCLRKEVLG